MLAKAMKYCLPFLLLGLPIAAQLPPPNAMGTSAGHHILTTRDLDASNKFWTALGGEPAALGPLKLIKFPGVLFLVRKAEHAGGTEGSTIDAVVFKVRDLKAVLKDKEVLPGATKKSATILGPDAIKIHLVEDKKLASPIACTGLIMAVPKPADALAWYAKYFGEHIPGADIQTIQSKPDVAPTKGRAFDRIGLEVQDLEATVKRLQGSGAKFDGQIRKAQNMALAVAVLTDPWGTYIEISQGLAAVK
jgi:hypothetical protein